MSRCVVPECEGWGEVEFESEVAQALLPASGERCRRYAPMHPGETSCLRENFHPNDTIECKNIIYQNMDTIFAEVNMH